MCPPPVPAVASMSAALTLASDGDEALGVPTPIPMPPSMAASGQPHVVARLLLRQLSGGAYSGKLVLACVARQFKMVKGESMLISKWRRR